MLAVPDVRDEQSLPDVRVTDTNGNVRLTTGTAAKTVVASPLPQTKQKTKEETKV